MVIVGGLAQERLADPRMRKDQEAFAVHSLDDHLRYVFGQQDVTYRRSIGRLGRGVTESPAEHAGVDSVRTKARDPEALMTVVEGQPLREAQGAMLGKGVSGSRGT